MIIDRIQQAINIKEQIIQDEQLLKDIDLAASELINCFSNKRKALFCGNGGSAADAQHLAAELSGKFYLDRPAVHAEACHVNSSFITAYSNDFNFNSAYERYIEATGKPEDVLVAISTSGNSTNILNAAKKAKELGMIVISLTGIAGGMLKNHSDINLRIPSKDTPRIQEAQIMIGHIICELVELSLFQTK